MQSRPKSQKMLTYFESEDSHLPLSYYPMTLFHLAHLIHLLGLSGLFNPIH